MLEAKKVRAGAHTKGFGEAMLKARAQAESYARALPASEGRPPFLIVADVGHAIELYAEVTRDVAAHLAELARSLEASGHASDQVAAFLTRALFCMFAEDVALLPKDSFRGLLEKHANEPYTLVQMLRMLWKDMDSGDFSAVLAQRVLRFNGKIFKGHAQEGYVLPLTKPQIHTLLQAAKADWKSVEPAIFGTLLERALNPEERHAYVERLVLPTVIEPLRQQWADTQAAALLLAREADDLLHPARAGPGLRQRQLFVRDAGAPQAPGGRSTQPAGRPGRDARQAGPGGRDRHAQAVPGH